MTEAEQEFRDDDEKTFELMKLRKSQAKRQTNVNEWEMVLMKDGSRGSFQTIREKLKTIPAKMKLSKPSVRSKRGEKKPVYKLSIEQPTTGEKTEKLTLLRRKLAEEMTDFEMAKYFVKTTLVEPQSFFRQGMPDVQTHVSCFMSTEEQLDYIKLDLCDLIEEYVIGSDFALNVQNFMVAKMRYLCRLFHIVYESMVQNIPVQIDSFFTDICIKIMQYYKPPEKKFAMEPLDVFKMIADSVARNNSVTGFDITKLLYKWELYEEVAYMKQRLKESYILFYKYGVLLYACHCLADPMYHHFCNKLDPVDVKKICDENGQTMEKLYLTNIDRIIDLQVTGRFFSVQTLEFSDNQVILEPHRIRDTSQPLDTWFVVKKNIFEGDKLVFDKLSPSQYCLLTTRLKIIAKISFTE